MVNSESVVDIKLGDFGVVIGYQVDEFTHTWYAEVTDFELGLDSILTDTLGLNTSFDEPDVITSSVSSGFPTQLGLFLILPNHSLLLVSDLVNYAASLEHFFHLCLWPPRCQLLN